jgi:N-acetylmuramoyl-L-alanine amidase
LERVAADQAKQGTKVSRANLKAGDLVFYDTNGGKNYVNHVGIYIGDGMFIHASSGSNAHKVVISNLGEGFYSNAYMSAKRFLK